MIDVNMKIENMRIQDKINKYYKELYPKSPIQIIEEQIIGKVKDIIEKLIKNQKYVSNLDNEIEEELIEHINFVTKELIEELQNMNQDDIVTLFNNPMTEYYGINNSKVTLKKIQELYLEQMKNMSLECKNINSIVEICFDMNEIKDLMEYGADKELDTMKSLSNLFKEILKELEIPINDIYTNDGVGDGKYDITIVIDNGRKYILEPKAWDTPIEVTQEIQNVVNQYLILQQHYLDSIELRRRSEYIKEKNILHKLRGENALKDYVIDYYLSEDNVKQSMEDLQKYGCQSGMIGTLIYYADTERFYNKYKEEINELAKDVLDSTGLNNIFDLIHSLEKEDPLMLESRNINTLAWFGFEKTSNRLYYKLFADREIVQEYDELIYEDEELEEE